MTPLPQDRSSSSFLGYGWAFAVTGLGTMAISPVRELVDLANVALLYVLVVVIIAVRFGRGPAVACSLFSALCYAYVFVPPHFSLAITEIQNLMAALLMLGVALMVGHLTSRLKQHADFASRQSAERTSLYELAQQLAGAVTSDSLIALTAHFLDQHLQARRIRVFLPADFAQGSADASPALLRECCERHRLLSFPTCDGRFYALLPLTATSGSLGVLGFEVEASALATAAAVEYLETVASVLAVALERSHFAEMARETEVKHAAESLRNSVLAALSHDLRTPLTSLVGMAENLVMGKVSAERQRHMLETIRNQALSISRQMTNLLDMARLSAGKLTLNLAWQPVEEVLGATLQTIRQQWRDREISVDLEKGLPPINIDAVLMERVLWNLLENAIKYSPPDSPIELAVRRHGEQMEIAIADAGPGVPPEQLARIFEVFQRGSSESTIPGVGLGLAIARTIAEAHGGTLSVHNRLGGGACFTVTLPLGQPPCFDEEEVA